MESSPTDVISYPLLCDEELKTLRSFVLLEMGSCENNHEVDIVGKEPTQRVLDCSRRKHFMIISCFHAEQRIFGQKGAADILKETIPIFKKSDKNMGDKIYLYSKVLRMFDFIRQALEGRATRLMDHITSFTFLAEELQQDQLVNDIIRLAEDFLASEHVSDILKKGDARFLVRFRSLKNIFSSEWEPKILAECKKYAQELLDHQSD